MRIALSLLCLSLAAQAPHYTAADAVRAEWARTPPDFSAEQLAQLPAVDRARLDLSLRRIGRPGAPALLPPELEKPSLEAWEAKLPSARTPEERFTALFFLNRYKSTKALAALDGLSEADAKTWPKHLHLEALIASARINGCEAGPQLQAFLNALKKAGKVDPVRAQAAQLRLVMAKKEKELLPAVKTSPGAMLALMDAWNRGPVDLRSWAFAELAKDPEPHLGLSGPGDFRVELQQRLMEGLPANSPEANREAVRLASGAAAGDPLRARLVQLAALTALGAQETASPEVAAGLHALQTEDPLVLTALLPALRRHAPQEADVLRAKLLAGSDPVARAAAIDDLAEAPADLDTLAQRCFHDAHLESSLELFTALDRWKLPAERQKALLAPFLQHPDWGWRYQAWLQLRKTDPAAAWPEAPAERPGDKALLAEALRLAKAGKPLRLRVRFSGHRSVVLRLAPKVAPINAANLELLAKQRFFDGHRVPRVVPDFVVQMGSPLDTMDGGPGYSVRCEDSLTWYGPGSVGMALAGKDTGGCQLFITTNATPHLTGKYTRVGEVEDPDRALPMLDALELGARILKVEVLR